MLQLVLISLLEISLRQKKKENRIAIKSILYIRLD